MSRNPIYTYLPNLIGYVRLLLALLSIVFYNQPGIFFFCYFACFCGDGLDGYAARKTNHVTLFGSLLDMFTDRGCIVALFCNLASLYPMLSGFFMALAFLDVASHFVRMYSSQLLGFTSHKDSKSSHSTPLLNMYYKSRFLLTFICGGHETFWLFIYLLSFVNYLPPAFSKSLTHFLYSITLENTKKTARITEDTAFFGNLYTIKNPIISGLITFFVFTCSTVTVLKIYIHVQQLRSGMMDIADTELKTLKKSHKT